MDSPRTVSRVELKTDLSAQNGSVRKLTLSTDLAAARGPGEETYALDLIQEGRHLASFTAHYPAATRRLAGNWKIDLRDGDSTPFLLDRPLPTFSAEGEGQFEADATFGQVHGRGHLHAAGSRWEVVAPALERLGPATIEARFDLAENGAAFRVEHLDFSVKGERLTADVQALQPFDFDGRTRAFKVPNPGADWADISFRGFPLAWLSDPANRLTFAGTASGELVARAAAGGFAAHAKAPLRAAGVSLQSGERVLAQGLELSIPRQADYTAEGWPVRCAPLQVTCGPAGPWAAWRPPSPRPRTRISRSFSRASGRSTSPLSPPRPPSWRAAGSGAGPPRAIFRRRSAPRPSSRPSWRCWAWTRSIP